MNRYPLQISVVVTCKGRLRFLKQTAPKLIGQSGLEYVLVDWDCPEGSGDWLKNNYPQTKVVKVERRKWFHLAAARNLGALAASGELLVFSDVDMCYGSEFSEAIHSAWKPGKILLLGDREGDAGFVVMSREDFLRSGGYDERYIGYGYDDHEMRNRLEVLGLIPERLLNLKRYHVHHSNEDRTRYYKEKDKRVSQRINRQLLEDPIRMFHCSVLDAAGSNVPISPGTSTDNACELAALLKIVSWKKPRQLLCLYPFFDEVIRSFSVASPLAHVCVCNNSFRCFLKSHNSTVGKTGEAITAVRMADSTEHNNLRQEYPFTAIKKAANQLGLFDFTWIHCERSPLHVAVATHIALHWTTSDGTVVWLGYSYRYPEVKCFLDTISEKAITVVENTALAFIQLNPEIKQRVAGHVKNEVLKVGTDDELAKIDLH